MAKQTRPEILASYLVRNKATVRSTGTFFGMSKSTVHLDISKRLKKINPKLYKKASKILYVNFEEKHLRGGQATKRKWQNLQI